MALVSANLRPVEGKNVLLTQIYKDIARGNVGTDLTFICGEISLSYHQAILAPLSPFIRELAADVSCCSCKLDLCPNKKDVFISLDDVRPDVLELLMAYVYEGACYLKSRSDVEDLKHLHELLNLQIDVDFYNQHYEITSNGDVEHFVGDVFPVNYIGDNVENFNYNNKEADPLNGMVSQIFNSDTRKTFTHKNVDGNNRMLNYNRRIFTADPVSNVEKNNDIFNYNSRKKFPIRNINTDNELFNVNNKGEAFNHNRNQLIQTGPTILKSSTTAMNKHTDDELEENANNPTRNGDIISSFLTGAIIKQESSYTPTPVNLMNRRGRPRKEFSVTSTASTASDAFECTNCGAIFNSASGLSRHKKWGVKKCNARRKYVNFHSV